MIDILIAGLAPNYVPYATGWALQRRVHASVAAGERMDTLILLEHEAVYTAGTRTQPHERPTNDTEVIDVDRGGKITWHGPGQLVGYPILRLTEPVDVVAHVRRLERVLLSALETVDINAHQVPGRSGVWVGSPGSENKIAAIGVRVEKGVTMHGFAVNCNNTLSGFAGIIPCGIADAGVTTISEVLGRSVHPHELCDAVTASFETQYAGIAA